MNCVTDKRECPYCKKYYTRLDYHIVTCTCSSNDVSPGDVSYVNYIKLFEENKKLKREIRQLKNEKSNHKKPMQVIDITNE